MKTTILLIMTGITTSIFGQLTNTTGQTTAIPLNEVTHEKVNGTIITQSGFRLSGKITYSEYGEGHIYLYRPDMDVLTIENKDTISSMTLEGRGTFVSINVTPENSVKTFALITEKKNEYIVYQKLNASAGLLGYKISGGNIEGHYDYYLYHMRKDVYHKKAHVNNLKKNIELYVDYCPDVTAKVKNKEKGYKISLLMRDFDILKKVIIEAEENCPM